MKRSWLFVLALIPAILWAGAGNGQAASPPLFKIDSVKTFGCGDGDWVFNYTMSGAVDGGIVHTVVVAGGLVYTNENSGQPPNGSDQWGLYGTSSYGPTTGTWPMPAGHFFRAVFTVEKPIGNVLSSWTVEAKSCAAKQLAFNGPTSEDMDADAVSVYVDACPAVTGFRANGCPLVPRTLSVAPAYAPKRVTGSLGASAKAMYAGRKVTVWKVRPGPDLKVGTRTTGALGGFTVPVPSKGQYYATTPAVLLPKVGQALGKRSTTVVVK